jgi:hypothetical protein
VDETSTAAPQPDCATRAPVEVTVEAGKVYWWCACGRSRQQPFCDGSHKGTGFSPLRYQAPESGAKLFCVCKRTAGAPLCDKSAPECGA